MMMDQNSKPSFDKKGVFKAMIFALAVGLVSIGILGLLYRQIEKKLPSLEEQIRTQREEMEQKTAEDFLDKFMQSRVGKNEAQAILYLTEGAMQQKSQEAFVLVNDFESYEIINSKKLEENKIRFAVKIHEEGGMRDFVEVIILIKITGRYYVDSVEIAG